MTRTRPVALAMSMTLTVAGAVLLSPAPGVQARPRVSQVADRGDGGPNTYFSTPPNPLAGKTKAPRADRRPKPPPTKGTVTGQVTGPNGTPIPRALVTGIRFSDLGLPVDVSEEKRVLARTNGSGRFTLKQLREPYLIRVCSESVSGGGGHRARRSGECDQESSKRFTPSYLGPDGNLNSWMRHTRFFQPQLPHRSLGRIVVQPPAVVTGTWQGRRQPRPLPHPHRRQRRRDDGHRRQGQLPVRGRARPLPHRGRPRRGAAHRLDGPGLPVQAAPAARRPHHARQLQDPARRHHPRPGEHQRHPAPQPVPRDPRQPRRLRRRRGHQRDRPLRRQLAQARRLHRHHVVRRVGVRPEVADRRGRQEDRRHRRPGARPGPLGLASRRPTSSSRAATARSTRSCATPTAGWSRSSRATRPCCPAASSSSAVSP